MTCRFCDTPGKHMVNKICLACSSKGLSKADFTLKKQSYTFPLDVGIARYLLLIHQPGFFAVKLKKFTLTRMVKGKQEIAQLSSLSYYVRH